MKLIATGQNLSRSHSGHGATVSRPVSRPTARPWCSNRLTNPSLASPASTACYTRPSRDTSADLTRTIITDHYRLALTHLSPATAAHPRTRRPAPAAQPPPVMTVNPINVPYAAFGLPEDPCPAEEKESKLAPFSPSSIELPSESAPHASRRASADRQSGRSAGQTCGQGCRVVGRYSTVTGRWSDAVLACSDVVISCPRMAGISSGVTRIASTRRRTPCCA